MHVVGTQHQAHHAATTGGATAAAERTTFATARAAVRAGNGDFLLAIIRGRGLTRATASRGDADDSGQCQSVYLSNHVRSSQRVAEAGRIGGGGISRPCERASSAAAR